ncbi:hypothetical protein GXN76_11180 [Kroppenstedtia pulmonis]|uniref:Uncharacterized protein n=1 Tax=Kroppenstedtia pulmonis TaxID=1380685 RepID=A0A7D4CWF7_9BACL|nr:hypothetical protein [Kroppenstedtia pulmonis]QKG84977.1 hypothetical protein GXN76_11180 [Kroppenstedtia pulmonis]
MIRHFLDGEIVYHHVPVAIYREVKTGRFASSGGASQAVQGSELSLYA